METNGSKELHDGTLVVRVSGEGPAVTVAVCGELDLANAKTLAAELERAEAESPESITIDMRELEFIDSTGIAVLVSVHRRLKDRLVRVRMVPSTASGVRRVMDVTGLDDELPFVDPDGEPTSRPRVPQQAPTHRHRSPAP
jgi:anti-sigma B factor antagonist